MDDNILPPTTSNTISDNDDSNARKEKKQELISTGGISPEIISPEPVKERAVEQQESDYEKIKRLEQAAEVREKKEVIHKLPKATDDRKPQKKKKKTKKHKYTNPLTNVKYFGYRPPKIYLRNVNKIKRQVGRGNVHETKTWLLVFLDRLLKKESA